MLFPALVSQHIYLRDDPDLVLCTGPDDLFHVCIGEGKRVGQFRMRFELIMIVDEHEQRIDLLRAQHVIDKVYKGVYTIRSGGADAEAPYRYDTVKTLACPRGGLSARRKEFSQEENSGE